MLPFSVLLMLVFLNGEGFVGPTDGTLFGVLITGAKQQSRELGLALPPVIDGLE